MAWRYGIISRRIFGNQYWGGRMTQLQKDQALCCSALVNFEPMTHRLASVEVQSGPWDGPERSNG